VARPSREGGDGEFRPALTGRSITPLERGAPFLWSGTRRHDNVVYVWQVRTGSGAFDGSEATPLSGGSVPDEHSHPDWYSGRCAPFVFLCVLRVAPGSGNRAGWRPAQYSRRDEHFRSAPGGGPCPPTRAMARPNLGLAAIPDRVIPPGVAVQGTGRRSRPGPLAPGGFGLQLTIGWISRRRGIQVPRSPLVSNRICRFNLFVEPPLHVNPMTRDPQL